LTRTTTGDDGRRITRRHAAILGGADTGPAGASHGEYGRSSSAPLSARSPTHFLDAPRFLNNDNPERAKGGTLSAVISQSAIFSIHVAKQREVTIGVFAGPNLRCALQTPPDSLPWCGAGRFEARCLPVAVPTDEEEAAALRTKSEAGISRELEVATGVLGTGVGTS
jgi:hypothetical protein